MPPPLLAGDGFAALGYTASPVWQKAYSVSNQSHYDVYLDARELNCPMPLLKTKLALKDLAAGQVLRVSATDRRSMLDIPKFLELSDHQLLDCNETEGVCHFWIKKGA